MKPVQKEPFCSTFRAAFTRLFGFSPTRLLALNTLQPLLETQMKDAASPASNASSNAFSLAPSHAAMHQEQTPEDTRVLRALIVVEHLAAAGQPFSLSQLSA